MSINEEAVQMKRTSKVLFDYLVELSDDINYLLDYPIDEQQAKIKEVQDGLDESLNQLKKILSCVDYIQSYIGTELFLVNAIRLGLPSRIAFSVAKVPMDSYLIKNEITSLRAVAGVESIENPKEAIQQLSKNWIRTTLGDQGELKALESLFDMGIAFEEIAVKPRLTNTEGRTVCPDFYCAERKIICDAKAWKKLHSESAIQNMVSRYAKCFEEDGEVIVFFPKDIYEVEKLKIDLIRLEDSSVKVTVLPLKETYKSLQLRRELFYQYIKRNWA